MKCGAGLRLDQHRRPAESQQDEEPLGRSERRAEPVIQRDNAGASLGHDATANRPGDSPGYTQDYEKHPKPDDGAPGKPQTVGHWIDEEIEKARPHRCDQREAAPCRQHQKLAQAPSPESVQSGHGQNRPGDLGQQKLVAGAEDGQRCRSAQNQTGRQPSAVAITRRGRFGIRPLP